MIPELAATYHLKPSEIWDMDQRQFGFFLDHHKRMHSG
jgi:hypothetical protein